MKQELKINRDVLYVSRCASTPVQIVGGYNMRNSTMTEKVSVKATPIDEEYIRATQLQITAGQDFTLQDMKDVEAPKRSDRVYHFILNESAARQLGWSPEEAIDKKMFMGDRAGFVKGVIKDFHFESLHNAIRPLVLFTENRGWKLLIKVRGRELPSTISFLESKWKEFTTEAPFEFRFMDDDYLKLYRSEMHLGKIMNLFSGIAITLSCLGLFGLSAFMTQQRIKEIGIRKILGASTANVIALLSGNFLPLISVSILIAIPVAYFLMKYWLQGFVYGIKMEWWVFAAAGLAAIGIVIITVSFQGLKASRVNPSTSLKSE